MGDLFDRLIQFSGVYLSSDCNPPTDFVVVRSKEKTHPEGPEETRKGDRESFWYWLVRIFPHIGEKEGPLHSPSEVESMLKVADLQDSPFKKEYKCIIKYNDYF